MLWIKALHVIFVVSWFAGLFYLPRLFVYHAEAKDHISSERFKLMERKLYRGIMMPAMVLTLASGLWMWFGYGFSGGWLHTKVALVALLVAYHFWIRKYLGDFARDANRHSHVFYRWVNEVPTVLLVAIVILVVVKPY
ncbi:MAG TPA: protoporphyrinogen oxidase HemJ [Usitatibacter sp.]|nr:protoporphyrinogen oxidase HemJ [Usitatibacter sp.]